jgi:hypothetical protein
VDFGGRNRHGLGFKRRQLVGELVQGRRVGATSNVVLEAARDILRSKAFCQASVGASPLDR